MNLKFFCILICLLCSLSVGAQEIWNHRMDEISTPMVQEIFQDLASHGIMRSDYTQKKTITSLNRELTSSGTFIFMKDRGMAWLVKRPFPMNIIVTENAIIQQSIGGLSQIIDLNENPTFHRFSRTVQAIFLGDFTSVNRDYLLYFQQEETGGWTMVLKPKDEDLQNMVSYFQLTGHLNIQSFLIAEAAGDQILYQFQNLEFPETLLPEETLVFP
ncbi:MAG: outer membrane lipoprotein carrier protein LolA [Spirochaetaceae bacterium]|jgi:outer membrane lipoprotein-sorting protein|nr:outer membrane lipoprotein carrier protein LolA [Spirochaetaceae bacterium]